MYKYIAILVFLASANAQTPIAACENGAPLATSLDFNGCTESPCNIQLGTTASMNLTFTAPKDLETIHAEVVAFALGIETPYPLPNSDVCEGLVNTVCPVGVDEEVIWNAGMEILDVFPAIPLELEFSIFDAPDGERLNCVHVSAQTVN